MHQLLFQKHDTLPACQILESCPSNSEWANTDTDSWPQIDKNLVVNSFPREHLHHGAQ